MITNSAFKTAPFIIYVELFHFAQVKLALLKCSPKKDPHVLRALKNWGMAHEISARMVIPIFVLGMAHISEPYFYPCFLGGGSAIIYCTPLVTCMLCTLVLFDENYFIL